MRVMWKKSSIVKKEFGKSWDKVSDPQDSANVCCEFLRGIVTAFPKVVHRTLCSQEHLEGQNLGRFCIRGVIIGLGYTRITVLGSFHLNSSPTLMYPHTSPPVYNWEWRNCSQHYPFMLRPTPSGCALSPSALVLVERSHSEAPVPSVMCQEAGQAVWRLHSTDKKAQGPWGQMTCPQSLS